jgi:16S rRNA (guanine966-N2)-methyltransferase
VTRIIAGTHRGRRLRVPSGTGTRPTSDRAREGLFSSLLSLTELEGADVLDLYAGSGALGLEAVSRGARAATFVEEDPLALQALRDNVATTGLAATVVDADVSRFLQQPPTAYRLVVADPPYAAELDVRAVLPWLEPDGVLVLERPTRGPAPVAPDGLSEERSRAYGEATLWYFRRS